MLSRQTIDRYRKMSLGERLSLTLQAIRESSFYMQAGSPEVVARRYELLRRENDLRNANMLNAFARTRENSAP